MKKNTMMRIASILLVAVLLTTSVVSGTYAKYVTSGTVEDQARVAKFGVVLAAQGELFDVTYKAASDNNPGNSEGNNPHYDTADSAALTVESSNGDKLVAPGTQNDTGMTLSVTGTPEVDVRIKFDFDAEALKDVVLKTGTYPDMTEASYWKEFTTTADYYPIVFTVKGKLINSDTESTLKTDNDKLTVNANENTMSGNLAAIKKALENLNTLDKDNNDGTALGYYVDANTNLGTDINSLTITWKWAFEGQQTLNGTQFDATTVDKADTLLGDLAAGNLPGELSVDSGNYSINVGLKLTVTVTQVD